KLPALNVTLIDLSQPMLDRAVERIRKISRGRVTAMQGDVRDLPLAEGQFDVIVAAAVLHHLRDDGQGQRVFAAFARALRPGGSLWISDLVVHELPAVHNVMWARYGRYLANLKGEAYRDEVFAYIEKEDTQRSLPDQL